MSPIVLCFCGSLVPVFMSKAKCKVIFNYPAFLLNKALLMQASVSDINDKETAPAAEHKWGSAFPFSVTQTISVLIALNVKVSNIIFLLVKLD